MNMSQHQLTTMLNKQLQMQLPLTNGQKVKDCTSFLTQTINKTQNEIRYKWYLLYSCMNCKLATHLFSKDILLLCCKLVTPTREELCYQWIFLYWLEILLQNLKNNKGRNNKINSNRDWQFWQRHLSLLLWLGFQEVGGVEFRRKHWEVSGGIWANDTP